MAESHKNLETTRVPTSLGTLVLLLHPHGVRAALAFSQSAATGKAEWHAQCVDFYGQGIPPISSRVPQSGGYASLEELERGLVEEAATPMQTDYWSDR